MLGVFNSLQALLAATVSSTLSNTVPRDNSCPSSLQPSADLVVSPGWAAQLVVKGLSRPRGIMFDPSGALLVVESGSGIRHITFNDNGGTCLFVNQNTQLMKNTGLNHGIQVGRGADGKYTLYASSSQSLFSWGYDPDKAAVSGNPQTLVTNMSNTDHSTRTLLLSKRVDDHIIISHGSAENIDLLAADKSSGHSQLKAFNLTSLAEGGKAVDFASESEGTLIGWGLRNSVGVAEHPLTGGIYTVENSADEIKRQGQDIHEDDPGEEMNFHGALDDAKNQWLGTNYGYPSCYALWSTKIPNVGKMQLGDQFSLNPTDATSDDTCMSKFTPPRLTFQSHMAPLDIKFSQDGNEAYVSFHGSWDRTEPSGYRLSSIAFANGEPVADAHSTTSEKAILANADNSKCPGACFRPVGIAVDSKGRVWMSSDSTGEIYVLQKTATTRSASDTETTTASQTSQGSPAKTDRADNAGVRSAEGSSRWIGVALACGVTLLAVIAM